MAATRPVKSSVCNESRTRIAENFAHVSHMLQPSTLRGDAFFVALWRTKEVWTRLHNVSESNQIRRRKSAINTLRSLTFSPLPWSFLVSLVYLRSGWVSVRWTFLQHIIRTCISRHVSEHCGKKHHSSWFCQNVFFFFFPLHSEPTYAWARKKKVNWLCRVRPLTSDRTTAFWKRNEMWIVGVNRGMFCWKVLYVSYEEELWRAPAECRKHKRQDSITCCTIRST